MLGKQDPRGVAEPRGVGAWIVDAPCPRNASVAFWFRRVRNNVRARRLQSGTQSANFSHTVDAWRTLKACS